MSYVLGTATERANRVVLEPAEIRLRMQRVKDAQKSFLLVTKPENRPAYDTYVDDVRYNLQNYIRIEEVKSKIDGGNSASANQQWAN